MKAHIFLIITLKFQLQIHYTLEIIAKIHFTYWGKQGCATLQEILKHGSCFLQKKSLNMGPIFWLMAKTPKIVKFVKNGPVFQEKSLTMGTLFCQNDP